MKREELSNMQGALNMFDETLSDLESMPGEPTTNQLLILMGAFAGLQVAMLAEISDKLSDVAFATEELRQMRHNEIHN